MTEFRGRIDIDVVSLITLLIEEYYLFMKIQIYSHKTPEDALMSAKLGVDFVGVATGERGRLPLEVSYARCRDIFSAVSLSLIHI